MYNVLRNFPSVGSNLTYQKTIYKAFNPFLFRGAVLQPKSRAALYMKNKANKIKTQGVVFMAVQVYTFKVTYKHCEGKIWRIFDVSSNSDLALLGYMILASFDTMAYHLFSIECNNTIYETAIENYGEYPLLQETKLSELGLKIGQHLEMVYDFGCEQEFDIELIKISDMRKGTGRAYPKVIDGAGRGIIDDMHVFDLMKIIERTDKNGKSDFEVAVDCNRNMIWDYRNYNIKYDNYMLKGYIEVIRKGYEEYDECEL